MRDLLILAIIGGGSLYALRQPWFGAVLWTWVSILNPHREFGYVSAYQPVAAVVAGCTLLGLLVTPQRQHPFKAPAVGWMLAFMAWTWITLPSSLYFEQSLDMWDKTSKIFLMLFVTLALLRDEKQLHWFIYAVVLSLGFYGVKGGVFTATSGGVYRVWGPPGTFIEGNNEIGLALIMAIPLMHYLQMRTPRRWEYWAWYPAMGLTALTVLGTHSRGALLSLAAMALFFWWRSEKKGIGLIVLLAIGLVGLSFMPEHWWSRMETIQTYEQDESAMGRLNAWQMAFNLANDRFFGGGFSIYWADIFQRYAPNPKDIHAAHSIYFQVLGEHGWVGLLLFMALWISTWRSASQLRSLTKGNEALRWAGHLGSMVQVGLIGYATGGAFLSLAYFDLPYNMMAMVAIAVPLVKEHLKATAPVPGRLRPGSLRGVAA
ncbi:putative O-glycosylation ligase, exosortase A system-associated [Inhella proteolytica]|uniref:O-glycosylation ligase, exosortase A system-associated n=1 Tax=Inhella proteolytica TaxID=2795029 RepID=A0A931NHH1_9BURK|nr:putative O-glycosylation ligase, exosortase A system-associated [Inhella proteolytica]MBH9576515.1 putative O-glycosylation ligase, exosortase A system-associated [Inhella proteolytica]